VNVNWWLWGPVAGFVYCVGFVVTYGLELRFCKHHKAGHTWKVRSYSGQLVEKRCRHTLSFESNCAPWLWPLALVAVVGAGLVALPFVAPVWLVRKGCQRVERRLMARHVGKGGVAVFEE